MSKTVKVTLENPVIRGQQEITEVELRRPTVNTLKGTSLTDVLNMDVNALVVVLPRLTTPTLTQRDVQNMDPADLLALGQEVSAFLVPKSVVDQVKAEIGEKTEPTTSTGATKESASA